MKKYLFDKIKVHADNVQFIPFRPASILESFMANTHTMFNQDEWEFIPYSFKEFLKMLSKTKLNDSGEYDITVPLPMNEEPISFDLLLKDFANQMYSKKAPDRAVLAAFYSKAHQIREEAQKDKDILNMEPEELIK
ncbi:MAG: hypothetical protein E7345_01660 [Clostridiales bacterium]|nr:hypothetical protein [Clostridiales bacterium]